MGGMERTTWIEIAPNQHMGFVDDYILGVELNDNGKWDWDVSCYGNPVVADECDTERGAKTAASRFVRRPH